MTATNLRALMPRTWPNENSYETTSRDRYISRQYDLGVWWRWPNSEERWRLTMVTRPREVVVVSANTGELGIVATLVGSPPADLVLPCDGSDESRLQAWAERDIYDWAYVCGRPGSLGYIVDQMRRSDRFEVEVTS